MRVLKKHNFQDLKEHNFFSNTLRSCIKVFFFLFKERHDKMIPTDKARERKTNAEHSIAKVDEQLLISLRVIKL